MAKLQTYTCDAPNCNKQKAEVNHWLLGNDVKLIAPTATNITVIGIQVAIWNHQADIAQYHFCGQECAIQFASIQLSKLISNQMKQGASPTEE